MTSLLNHIIDVLPVFDIPELVVQYLAGDVCLDPHSVYLVFKKIYILENPSERSTFLDEDCKILHSFDEQPARIIYGHEGLEKYWFFNGKCVCRVLYFAPYEYEEIDETGNRETEKYPTVYVWDGKISVNGIRIQ